MIVDTLCINNKTFLNSKEDNIHKMLWTLHPQRSFFVFFFSGNQSDLDRQLLEEQWEMACEMMQEKAAFVFGKQGCLTDTDLHTVLKVRQYSVFKSVFS